MGVGSSRPTSAASSNYDLLSDRFSDHYELGDTLGRGAFGVVRAAVLRPDASHALLAADLSEAVPPRVRRRRRFMEQPLAVKVLRQDPGAVGGDSLDKLQRQITRLEQHIRDFESATDAQDSNGTMERVEELNGQLEVLRGRYMERARDTTKNTPREMLLREVSLLGKCDHCFIMRFVETFVDDVSYCVVFERCYGSLQDRWPAGVLEEPRVARQSYQFVSALAYLHGLRILHRDLKPENIMLRSRGEDTDVILGDFGLAVELRPDEDRFRGCAGTPSFMAPEGFHSYYQSFASDVWSCGCSLYWMMLGQLPFQADQPQRQVDGGHRLGDSSAQEEPSISSTAVFRMLRTTRMGRALANWKPQFERDRTAQLARNICHPTQGPPFTDRRGNILCHDGPRDLISRMLAKLPADRITAEEAIRHPWLVSASTAATTERSSQDVLAPLPETPPAAAPEKEKKRSSRLRPQRSRDSMSKVVPVVPVLPGTVHA